MICTKVTRRTFSAALVGMTAKGERRIAGAFVNDAFPLGHKLRDRAAFPAPKQQVRVPVVIVGGGIAGLSAAWRLDKRGFHDFVVLEMEPEAGGNSRAGQNEITRYPWAAHYVPVPAKGASLARELFEEFGAYRDGKWDERVLCFAPQERLFLHGRWQEGLEPELGAGDRDREQYRRFNARIQELRGTGQFTLPMELGAKASPLDAIPMTEWMRQQKLDSPYLRWYVDYACRDDFGTLAKDTSAWAGIHYFAAREPEDKGPLVWPEGNGWITRKLLGKVGRYVRTGSPVYRIARDGAKLRVLTPQVEYLAESVIFAAPTFLAHYLIEDAPPAAGFQYSPWLTANLTLERQPAEAEGAELAWDNVIYDSPALGYVNATHMSIASRQERTVWTFYWALAEQAPEQGRRLLLDRDWNAWKEAILNDLSKGHPDIRECVSRVDIMRFGHAMARPVPGFVFSEARKRWLAPLHRIHFANSDLSGFSIFEEAQYRGVRAADAVLRQ